MYKKTWPTYMLSTRDAPQNKRSKQAETKGMEKKKEKIFQANEHEKHTGVWLHISDKIDFKTKAIIRHRKGHYIIIKGVVQQEDITLINIYAPNIGAPK